MYRPVTSCGVIARGVVQDAEPVDLAWPEGIVALCCDDPRLFMVPVEALGPEGIDPSFAALLQARRSIHPAWFERFDAAWILYLARSAELSARAPEQWMPPRRQNVCVSVASMRPWYQPLDRASWLVPACDFDASTPSVELGVYRLVVAERIGIARGVLPAIVETLPYLLVRSDAEIAGLVAAIEASTAPDRHVLDAVVEALPAIRAAWHRPLRPPPDPSPLPLRTIRGAELLAEPEGAAALQALGRRLKESVAEVVERHLAPQRPRPGHDRFARELSRWLAGAVPRVLVVDPEGELVWNPVAPHRDEALLQALGGIAEGPAASMREDLRVIGARSEAFLASLRDPSGLPAPGDEVEQDGGVFLHRGGRLVAYGVRQPGLDPVQEAGPPMHRRLLAARTIHEWGHLAEAAGWIGPRPGAEEELALAEAEVAERFDALVRAAPAAFAAAVHEEIASLGWDGAPGELVVRLHRGRMSDYASNLLARHYLRPDELEAYVRSNVVSHEGEGLGPLRVLARYALEAQYLRLGVLSDPWCYLAESTWLRPLYLDAGLVDADRMRALLDATARVCATQWIDPGAIDLPRP